MAEKQSSLGFRLLTGDKEAKRKVKPKRAAEQKPKQVDEDVAVRPTYGLVFDPSGFQTGLLSEEQKAARDLYMRRARQQPDETATPRDLLESAGYLKPGVSREEAKKVGKPKESRLYASAMDALDAIQEADRGVKRFLESDVTEYIPSPIDRLRGRETDRTLSEDIGEGVSAVNRAAGSAIGPAAVAALGVAQPYTLLGTTETGRRIAGALPDIPLPVPGLRKTTTVGEALGAAGENVAESARALGRVREEMRPAPGSMTGGGARGAGAPVTAGLKKTRPLQDIVFSTVGKMPLLYGSAAPESTTEYFSIEKAQDWSKEAVNKPNKYVDASAEDKTVIKGASKPVAEAITLTLDGVNPDEIQTYLEQSEFDGLSPNEDAALKARARKAGHDVGQWDSLLPGEKIDMAYTSSNYALVTMRNTFRAVASMGATPAAIKAIGDAGFSALRGNTEEGARLIEGIISPYAYAKQVAERDGLGAGLAVAFRENPVDVALAVSAGVRTLGRVGGVAARTGKFGARAQEFAKVGRPVTIAPKAATEVRNVGLTPGPFRYVPGEGTPTEQYARWQQATREMRAQNAAEIQESVATGRVFDDGTPYRIEEIDVSPSVTIGYTTPNLTSGVSLALKSRLAGRLPKYADRLLKSQGYNYTRTQANIADGVAVEIERILTEALGKRPTDEQKARAAWDLSRPIVLFGDERYTPRAEADFYRAELENLKQSPEYIRRPNRAIFTDQIKRWEAAIDDLERLERVEIDPQTTARVREAAAGIGEKNTKLIAAALGVTVKEAKRADYIRLLVIDPRFETAARALKAEKNLGKTSPKALIASQRRIRVLSRKIKKSVTTRGVGKKSAPKSRVAFAALRNKLVVELRRAERAALEQGDEALANQYRDARTSLVLARASAPERAAAIAEQIAAVGRLEARATELPSEARPAYVAAQEARRAEDIAERESVAATTAQREALAAAGVRAVNQNAIDAAEAALEQARRNYEVDKDSTMLTPEQIEQSRLAVNAAEQRLDALREAQAATAAGMGAREALRTAIGRRESAVREAQRIIRTGAGVIDTGQVRAALDASERLAAVRIRKKKDYDYYTLERARGETLDQFIARVEANDEHAILHLVQKGDFVGVDEVPFMANKRLIDTSAKGRIRSGRLRGSKGEMFYIGGEDFSRGWRNLMFDTSELQSAAGWQRKMQQLIEAVSLKVTVSESIMQTARREAESALAAGTYETLDEALRASVMRQLRIESYEFTIGDFELINPISPKARMPRKREPAGSSYEANTVADFMRREITERTIDPNAPGSYYLVPKALFDGIQKSLNDEAFRFQPKDRKISAYNLDRLMRAWRTLTLNVLPKTAFANITGSAILALQGGAGPRSWYMAWRALTGRTDPRTGRPYPIPKELLQRYYDQFTPEIRGGRRVFEQPDGVQVGAAWIAWWMNNMRRLNGMSEDFGRLAVWYSKAVPEALSYEARGVDSILSRAKRLNDDAMDLLESMANNDPQWASKNAAWLRQSYDFLGYLHRGGEFASWMRIAIPFWQWYIHMLKLTFATMPVKYPGRALFLQQLGQIGDEYQRTHGVIIPWGQDIIPVWSFTTEVEGQPQWVTTGIGSSTWYPQGTPSEIADKNGALNIAGYVRGSINPQISNTFLIGLSLAMAAFGRPAVEFSDYTGLKAAKNEYGNEITSAGDFANYIANRVGQMMPLAPMVMSLAGRPANSTLWNLEDKMASGPEIERRRTDLVTLISDPFGPNALTFLLKAFTGLQFTDVPGLGPVDRARLRKLFEYEARNASREEKNIAEKIAQIQRSGNTYDAQVSPARPGGTEQ